jgi:N-terminal domain of toast_rack, DUF2154
VNTRSSARVLSTSLACVAVAGAISCGTSGPVGPVVHEHHSVERGGATSARVEIGMTAGDLEVKSGAKMLFEGNFDFNVPVLKPEIAYAVDGTTGTLKVSQGSTSGNYENSWRLSIDETTPVDLHLTLGAGDAELVLGRVNLQSLAVRLGAGDLVLDLRGTPARSYKVTVQAGAGDTTIRLPAGVGISAGTSGLIGDSNVSGLEKRDGRWINPRAEASPVTIDLQVQHAIGDLKIVAE